jgi:hypothetical protein
MFFLSIPRHFRAAREGSTDLQLFLDGHSVKTTRVASYQTSLPAAQIFLSNWLHEQSRDLF